jgi:gamma-glutamyltranspeptidase
VLFAEDDVPDDVVAALTKRGHHVIRSKPGLPPAAQMILRHGPELEAASDPRKGGAPAAP